MVERKANIVSSIPKEAGLQERIESPDEILKMYMTLTVDKCTTSIVKTVLKHLQPDLVPNIALGEYTQFPYTANGNCAAICIHMLSTILDSCRNRKKLKEETLELMTEDTIEGICMWIKFCLHFGLAVPGLKTPAPDLRRAYLFHAQLLCSLFDSAPKISAQLLVSSTFLDLVIQIWMAESETGEVFILLEGTKPEPCPIASLLLKVANFPMGPSMLTHRIIARSPSFASAFAEQSFQRGYQLVEEAQTVGQLANAAFCLERQMSTMVALLSHSSQLHQVFTSEQYIKEYAMNIHSLFEKVPLALQTNSKFIRLFFMLAETLFLLLIDDKSRVVHNYRDILSEQLLQHIYRLLPEIPSTDMVSTKIAAYLLKVIGIYIVYPCVFNAAMEGDISEETMDRLKRLEVPSLKDPWEELSGLIFELFQAIGRLEVDTKTGGSSNICDNLLCARKEESGLKFKQCSKCSSVIYCSSACQRIDWDKLHRDECERARLEHDRHKASQTVYSQDTRIFHTAYLESLYNRRGVSAMANNYKNDCPGLEAYQVLCIINCSTVRPVTACSPLVLDSKQRLDIGTDTALLAESEAQLQWDREVCGEDISFPQTYLKPRFSQMVDDCLSGTPEEMRLAEGIFPLGNAFGVYLLVKLKKVNQEWKAESSLARYSLVNYAY
ncbi:hypothetical protein DFP72DRAFT_136444 [Ephemerocybe angulata]|uniref:MYND-type domain-containing protein n=1 Tax=Ephemerocybe angulata TaxID=980116 RepID=A0A8H6I8N9_9AGAR|nr:hypothetical protein DFP72DRAFT_136444 [Tulosesus angulatus]